MRSLPISGSDVSYHGTASPCRRSQSQTSAVLLTLSLPCALLFRGLVMIGLRSRAGRTAASTPTENNSPASASGRSGEDAAHRPDEARPRNNGRRDLFGVRSSLVVLAVLAYLFISRVMNASANGII